MVHKRLRGPYMAVVAALFAVLIFILPGPHVAAASSNCSWNSQTSVNCNGEAFTQSTTNGNTMTLLGNTTNNGCSGSETDTLTIDNYTSASSASLTTYNSQCQGTTSNVGLSGTYSKLSSSCPDGGSPVNGSCPSQNEASCGGFGFDWIICPGDTLFESMAQGLLNFMEGLMTINTTGQNGIFGSGQTSTAYYRAWNTFRILATGLIIIAGLVMVAAQAFGLEILDAYTIRKVLPRLLVAIIGISLSWPLMSFIITFFNVFGKDVQNLMYAPFSTLPDHSHLIGGIFQWGFVGVIITLLALKMGPILLPILGIGALDLLVAVFVLIVRQVAVAVLVITAPFAIAAYVLPNTKKIWDFWKDNFLGVMFMFPIITMLMAAGQIFGAVGKSGGTAQQIVGIVAFFVPYFLIPFAFRMASGIVSNISGWMHDRRKTLRGRLRGAAGSMASKRWQDIRGYNAYKGGVEGEHANLRGRVNKLLGRAANINQAGFNPARMGSQMRGFESRHSINAAAEFREKNEAFKMISGNEDYLNAALDSHGSERELRRILRFGNINEGGLVKGGYDDATINQAVAQIRHARQNVTDEVFEKAAVLGLSATGTGLVTRFDDEGNIIGGGAGEQNKRINEIWGSDRVGAVSALVAARSLNSAARRFDISGGSTSGSIKTLEGQYHGTVTEAEATKVTIAQALEGQGGSYVAGARKGAVESFAPVMLDKLNMQFSAKNGGIDEVGLSRELAKIAGRYDAMAQVSPENAEVLAKNVMSRTLDAARHDSRFEKKREIEVTVRGADGKDRKERRLEGTGEYMTVREMIEAYRGDDQFLNMRKEYGFAARQGASDATQAAANAAYQEMLQRQQNAGPGGPVPPVMPPPPGFGPPI